MAEKTKENLNLLSEADHYLLSTAGTTADPVVRRRSVALVLSEHGAAQDEARDVLAKGYAAATQPSFHYIPRGTAMYTESDFNDAYEKLMDHTKGFTRVNHESLVNALTKSPETLAPLRMILGFTYNELAVAMRYVDSDSPVRGDTLKKLERGSSNIIASKAADRRKGQIETVAATILAVMNRDILQVPDAVSGLFHSKLDKRDTQEGWSSVVADSAGVPYSALLYQRYVGGVWRQIQDAYSEVKGDNLLENPIAALFDEEGVPYYRSSSGTRAANASTKDLGFSPGPDFAVPDDSPTVIIESKVVEDGGTARDKASRIKNLADAAKHRGVLACAVVDGKGWQERLGALADVVIATEGRTYSLATLPQLLEIPEVDALRGSAMRGGPERRDG